MTWESEKKINEEIRFFIQNFYKVIKGDSLGQNLNTDSKALFSQSYNCAENSSRKSI